MFDADPNKHPDARRYAEVTYDDVVANDLNVMDQSAFILARDHQVPIHVFDAGDEGAMLRVVQGEPVGTYVGPNAETRFADE